MAYPPPPRYGGKHTLRFYGGMVVSRSGVDKDQAGACFGRGDREVNTCFRLRLSEERYEQCEDYYQDTGCLG